MDQEENELYIQYSNSFKIIKLYDKNFISCKLNIKSDMWISMQDIDPKEIDREIDIILIKIQLFIDLMLDNAIVFSRKNDWAMKTFFDEEKAQKNIVNNIILTPAEPSDDHLTLLLQSKFDAIGNEKINFTSMSIKNKKTKNVTFIFVGDGKSVLPDMKAWIGEKTYHRNPWWVRNDLSTIDLIKFDNNIEKPFYDVDFESVMIENFVKNSLISNQNFNQNDQKEATIIRPKFKPRVIKNDDQ